MLASLGMLKIGPGATRRARWTVRLSFWGGVIVSLVANIAVAPVLAWRPILVAGWPPLALLAAVELLTHRARPQVDNETGQTARQNKTVGETSPARVERATDTTLAERAKPTSCNDETTSPGPNEEIVTTARADRGERTSVRQRAETVMWQHYQAELAKGRTSSGAELDRVAATNNYGRSVLARWRRTGRIPTTAPQRSNSWST